MPEDGEKTPKPVRQEKTALPKGKDSAEKKDRISEKTPPTQQELENKHREREQKRKEIKEKAKDRLELLQEKAKTEQKIEEIRQDVETVAADPEKHHVSFAIEKNQTLQDKDLILITKRIIDDARSDPNTGNNEAKLCDYINMVDAALADRPSDEKSKLLRFKARLAKQLGTVVIDRVKRENPSKTGLEEAEEYWRDKLVEEGSNLTAEDFAERAEKIPPIRGGQETWKLYDESSSDFQGFPENIQLLIQGVNDTAKFSPENFTPRYIEDVVGNIDKLNGQVPRNIKQELKSRLSEKLSEITESQKEEEGRQYFARLMDREEYKALGYERDDAVFLESTLRNPTLVAEMIEEDGSGFDEFQRELKNVFDHLFDAAASNRLEEFSHSWNFLVHARVREQIFANLDVLIDHFSKQEMDGRETKVLQTIKKDITNEVVKEPIKLSKALTTLRFRLTQEEELRRYNHNIHYVIRRRLPLERVAEFAQSLEANSVDVLFLEDENVQTACHFYVQELKKTTADEFWTMGTTWLGDNPQGQVTVEEKVKDKLRSYAKTKDQTLTERDLNRLISLAAGTVFGITGEGFDVLSQTKPPSQGGKREISGYFADNILPYWNLPHLYERFGIPGKVPELLYLKVMKGGKLPFTKEGQWDHRVLEKAREQGVKELKTGLLWSLSGGPPLIEVMSKNFGIRGALSRGSWRFLALTSHHLVGRKTEDGSRLPVFSSPINWEVSDEEAGDIDAKTGIPRKVANQMLWENIDWNESFKSLEKAGAGVMFSYWIDKRAAAEADVEVKRLGLEGKEKEKKHGEIEKQRQEELYKKYLWKTRNRNPLIFLRYDLAQSYKTSLRYRALGRVDEFRSERDNYSAIESEINEIEDDLMLVVEEITRRHAWRDEGGEGDSKWSAWDVIKSEDKREKAKKYWKALQTEIWNSEMDENGDPIQKEPGKPVKEISENFFKEKYFFFGSEDMDFQQVAMREAGFDMMKRVFGDINVLAKGVDEFMTIPDKLIAAAQTHDYKELIGSIDKICHAVESIHGIGEARRLAYYLTTMMTRYFDKSWWAQLPMGAGTVLNWITKSSLSEKVGGKRAWQWDESLSATFINDVRLTGYLEVDKEKDFNMFRLKAELGARRSQALYDVLRTAIPLIILLMMWQGAKEETKE